jgi:hypothetical protein
MTLPSATYTFHCQLLYNSAKWQTTCCDKKCNLSLWTLFKEETEREREREEIEGYFFLVVKGPAADATDALQPWGSLCNPMMMMIIIFCPFRSNGAPVEWNWQGKTEELGEKPVPVPLCPRQIPHALTRDRTRASALRGRRLTAWAMARPNWRIYLKAADLFLLRGAGTEKMLFWRNPLFPDKGRMDAGRQNFDLNSV